VPFPFSPNEHALPISFILEQLSNFEMDELVCPFYLGSR
jgi:hypothetical protein